jgi:hypothetical protein
VAQSRQLRARKDEKRVEAKAEQVENSLNSYLIYLFLPLIKPRKPNSHAFLGLFHLFLPIHTNTNKSGRRKILGMTTQVGGGAGKKSKPIVRNPIA